jgi:hypothetical protein
VSSYARYDKGDWKADCDVCGRTYKASQLQKRWDGLMCCTQDWEIRQPQDFVRGVADTQVAPWTRPEPADQFIPIHFTPTVWFYINSAVRLLTKIVPGKVLSASSTSSVSITKLVYLNTKTIDGAPINSTTIG